ncbi:MAG: cation diffusion facilitator family transporter [Longimicrobiales bacterium]
MTTPMARGIRTAQTAILVNAVLAMTKLVAGVVGNTYALVADAVESTADVFGSLVVWRGLQLAGREADDEYPFGYGKAEALAAAIVALILMVSALLITVQAAREIRTPHLTPAPWTLLVLVGVVGAKAALARHVGSVGNEIGSRAVQADAWHHVSDAVTSAAAFIGIGIALLGARYRGGSGWESADDWGALVAAAVIGVNGVLLLRPAVQDLMDRAPGKEVVDAVRRAAESVPGVLATEKLLVRRAGLCFRVTLHVQASARLTLHEAHVLSGMVKGAIRGSEPRVEYVLVHMEPYEGTSEPA